MIEGQFTRNVSYLMIRYQKILKDLTKIEEKEIKPERVKVD